MIAIPHKRSPGKEKILWIHRYTNIGSDFCKFLHTLECNLRFD
jgi:hypothetical protein